MSWGDRDTRAQIQTTLKLLSEGATEFQTLVTSDDDDKLVDKLAALDANRLRSIVFERVMAARYQPRKEAIGEG